MRPPTVRNARYSTRFFGGRSEVIQMKKEVPISEKSNLTLEEAAAYFGVGVNKLRELTEDRNCKFVLWVGSKRLIKRRQLDDYLDKAYSI